MIYKIDCVELNVNDYKEQYGKFIFESLEQGEGITLGNSLRRILLADLTGIAIVALRIAGINNEFSIIPGLREDVLEIILNLKQIVLKGNIEETVLGRLKVQGPQVITADLIEAPEITVVNSNQYIATIVDNSFIEIEFKIEKGKNYRLTDSVNSNDPTDFLQIDAIFMPVRRVSYEIDQIDIYSKLNKERLILEILTNGSLSPSEALFSAGKILQNLVHPIINDNFQTVRSAPSDKEKKLKEIPIEELVLSARAYNALKRAQINYIGDLIKYSVEELKEIKNFGQKSIEEVVSSLKTTAGINLT
jgi:DNA-directed RNA polymerase subunit alpha